jgi:hypothetical protein
MAAADMAAHGTAKLSNPPTPLSRAANSGVSRSWTHEIRRAGRTRISCRSTHSRGADGAAGIL